MHLCARGIDFASFYNFSIIFWSCSDYACVSLCYCSYGERDPGGSMSQVVGLPNNSYKLLTNTTWVRARLCKLQKGCTRLTPASDKVYQLLAHGRYFSLGTPASSTNKTGLHDIAEILLKVALSTINQIKSTYGEVHTI